MSFAMRTFRALALAGVTGLVLPAALPFTLAAQPATPRQAAAPKQALTLPVAEPSDIPVPLTEDRGRADLVQTLRRLGTTASVLMITAHPDDEDGGLLTFLSRGVGTRVTLLTINRGEGGQNAMSGDLDDALGLIRTNELLKSDEYYRASQLWGTEVDFGFSKTQEESFAKWTHERCLYDAVLAVRKVRPQVIVATFVGGVTDGHGQHQVSGEIAQEAFKAAADPKVFPEQLKDGLEPWQALAIYSDIPFAPIQNGQMFDYATGKWAAAGFKNYLTGEWINGSLSADVTVPVGGTDAVLGESYSQLARTGKSQQKSQFGDNPGMGGGPPGGGPATSGYHLWAVTPAAAPAAGVAPAKTDSLFQNAKVSIDTSIEGLAKFAGATPPAWLTSGLKEIQSGIREFSVGSGEIQDEGAARKLVPIYRRTLELETQVRASSLGGEAKAYLEFELDAKIELFQHALADLLGLDLTALKAGRGPQGGAFGSGQVEDSSSESVAPGEEMRVRVHTAKAFSDVQLSHVWLESASGSAWKTAETSGESAGPDAASLSADRDFRTTVSADAEPTQAYFHRASIEQPYYDLSHPEWRERSFAPWPLAAWAEFAFDGVPIRLGQVVQASVRVADGKLMDEPLVVTPTIGVSVDPQARILPLDGSALPVRVTVHAQAAAEGSVSLELPESWRSEPAEIAYHLTGSGDTAPLVFTVTPATAHADGVYRLTAVARAGGKSYRTGWRSVGYAGLRPYNLYTPSVLQTRKVDVTLSAGLRVAYIMGSGDEVPAAIEALGVTPHLLSASEIASADLSAWNVIVIGIRAYSTRPELTAAQARLNSFVVQGGTLIVQYQSGSFPAPLSLEMGGRLAERVVDETAAVKLLAPDNPLLNQPNRITAADFDGWVEERGHGFLDRWDSGYTALTETADPGQDPQRGGLLVAHPGKGTYIYVAYALYRQFPELVPGAYRLFANLLSAGR